MKLGELAFGALAWGLGIALALVFIYAMYRLIKDSPKTMLLGILPLGIALFVAPTPPDGTDLLFKVGWYAGGLVSYIGRLFS
jgi:hypothetical protein